MNPWEKWLISKIAFLFSRAHDVLTWFLNAMGVRKMLMKENLYNSCLRGTSYAPNWQAVGNKLVYKSSLPFPIRLKKFTCSFPSLIHVFWCNRSVLYPLNRRDTWVTIKRKCLALVWYSTRIYVIISKIKLCPRYVTL